MKALVIGIGCRRGVSVEQIQAAVRAALAQRRLEDVRAIASIDSKADEAGLLAFAARYALPLVFLSRAELARVEVAASAKVQEHVGIGAVSEACALLASRAGRIVVPKFVLDGVTVAIAADQH
jgi:cobalt-precorrin 5A hydrolase